jgi:hypothetical protein
MVRIILRNDNDYCIVTEMGSILLGRNLNFKYYLYKFQTPRDLCRQHSSAGLCKGDKMYFMCGTSWMLYVLLQSLKLTNSVTLVRERTIPTERPPLVGEVSVNFRGYRDVAWSARRFPAAVMSLKLKFVFN